MRTKLLSILIIALSMVVASCSKVTPGDYDSTEVGKIKKVVPGVIISMRPVRLHNKNEEVGLTSQAPAGQASTFADPTMARSHGFEYVIKLNSGSIISVVQTENIKLKTKQHILVIYGRNTRVVPDNGSEDF